MCLKVFIRLAKETQQAAFAEDLGEVAQAQGDDVGGFGGIGRDGDDDAVEGLGLVFFMQERGGGIVVRGALFLLLLFEKLGLSFFEGFVRAADVETVVAVDVELELVGQVRHVPGCGFGLGA